MSLGRGSIELLESPPYDKAQGHDVRPWALPLNAIGLVTYFP